MRSSAVRRYGLALLCVVLALLIRYLLDPFVGSRVPFATFFAATIFSAWYCRLGPGLVALLLGGGLASYCFIEPRGSLSLQETQDGISVVVYLATGLVTILLLEALQRARSKAEKREIEAQDAKRVTETLFRVGRKLATQHHLKEIVQTVTDETTSIARAEFGAFFYNVKNQEGESYTLYTLSGTPVENFQQFPMPRNTEIFDPTFKGLGIVRLDDVTKDPRFGKNAPYHGMPKGHLPVKSYLAVPVVSHSGEVLGGLFFGHSKEGVFTANDELLISGIAAIAGVAIENASLYGKLHKSEERLLLALDAGKMGVWDWNLNSGQIKWSDNIEAIHGLKPGSFPGTFDAYQKLIHPDDLARVNQAIEMALNEKSDYDIEFRIVWPDASVHWITGKGIVLAESGQKIRMVGVAMDVTARKRTEEDARFLAEVSSSLTELVDPRSSLQKLARLAVPLFADWCAIDLLDSDGKLQRVAVAHVDKQKVTLAQQLHERFPPDSNADHGVWNIIRTSQAEFQAEITDEMLIASIPNPELLTIIKELGLKSYLGVPLTIRGKTLGVITFIAAETGRRYKEQDLMTAQDLAHRAAIALENSRLYQNVKEADQRKDEFISLLAHELRNPLAPVSNGLQVLKLSNPQNDVATRAIEMMDRQVQHLVRLVDDLLDISRIVNNKIVLKKEIVTLGSILERAIEISQPLIDANRHQLHVNVSDESYYLECDRIRLTQVVSNLLNNATRYNKPGGQIWLTAEVQDQHAVIKVRDNGIGIEPSLVTRIWDLFVQGARDSNEPQTGLGIGLTLVRRIMLKHGGSAEVTSEGLGKGSLFTLRLPAPSITRQPEIKPVEEKDQAKLEILIVDDNVDAANSLNEMLQLLGHRTTVAHGGEEALGLVEGLAPHLAIIDLGMPKMDGYQLVEELLKQKKLSDMTLVALTGWGGSGRRPPAHFPFWIPSSLGQTRKPGIHSSDYQVCEGRIALIPLA